MPLGNQNQSNNKPFYLRIRTQDKDKQPIPAEFEVKSKDSAGEIVISSTKKVAGDLVSLKISKRTVTPTTGPAQEVDDVKIVLEDAANQEVYFLDARPTQLSRGLYNSLLNLKSGKGVSISLYQTKPNEQGKVYNNASVWQNDQLVKGKFSREQIPAPDEIKNKKGEVIQRDYEELNEFYFSKLKDLVNSFGKEVVENKTALDTTAPKKAGKKAKKTGEQPPLEAVQESLDEAAETQGPDDNIPF